MFEECCASNECRLSQTRVQNWSLSANGSNTDLDQSHSVLFTQAITNAIVVRGPVGINDGEGAIARIRNVTDTGFEFQIDEWNYQDGVHGSEIIGGLAVSERTHTLSSGQSFVAGSSGVGTGFTRLKIGATLTDAIIFAEVTSLNEADAVTPRMCDVTSTSFQVRIEEEKRSGRISPRKSPRPLLRLDREPASQRSGPETTSMNASTVSSSSRPL